MLASNAWAVQMLLVAFSRRICCSRVWSARRRAGRAARIFGDADDAAGHLAFESVARGEERGVRSAVTQRHAETLGAADGDVRAEFAGRFEQSQASRSVATVTKAPAAWALLDEGGVIVDRAVRVGILDAGRRRLCR